MSSSVANRCRDTVVVRSVGGVALVVFVFE